MDLINNLLQEKEHRLCSKKYHLNDFQHSKHVPGRLVAARADTLAWDYQGHYVYPDDAADIKAHAFFYGLTWDTLHLSRPPFIPEVNGRDDTKYFDEDSISDADDASSISTMQIGLDTTVPAGPTDSKPFTSACTLVNKAVSLRKITEGMNIGKEKSGKAREKKRPRDRALRDKEVGKRVLELRKKGAFLGYTYRRPIGLFYEEQDGFS